MPPDVFHSIAVFRYLLVALVAVCAFLLLRARPVAALAAALVFALAAVGFWVAALERPYGVLVDAGITRRTAERAVIAETGRGDEGFLAGEPRASALDARVALRLPRPALIAWPSWLPLLVLPLSALALYRLGGAAGATAALLWTIFATGDLDTLRGVGFVPGLWARPGESLALLATLALLGLARRWLTDAGAAGIAAALIVAAWVALPFPGAGVAPMEALLLLTFDQALWAPLGAWGLWRARSAPASTLASAGAALVLIGALRGGVDLWGAHALYRAGLILAAVGPLRDVARVVGEWLHEARPDWARHEATALGGALLLVLGGSASTLTWWEPLRWDPIARASVDPISGGILEPMDWIRRETPRDAVVLAAPDYAPAVAIFGGRRVLRASTLGAESDAEPRLRLERQVLTGRPPPASALLSRYGLRYVLAAPGDFQEYGLEAPHVLAERSYLRLVHVSEDGFRIYEILR